ncbi:MULTISPECIES: hypothetical protein [unclassified Lentimonas]|uniref:hypothetical protein n=1 Tax=unclassified Lentimonas TaxID=2630993 RepID=UPI0013286B8B|nr:MULTISPECIES: hypothetical protein [unclassified Lentimonas]CAA6678967.1 Unannotated [Lentimonas sp. CC4]CAA6685120.1 Unannotated [Lentimonas sp. CC6]CAA6696911.1 Unannotated [Lentimonas sp. CC19]CAA6697498.1 Unannotated [Lentimonas sp. CC10]CAA7071139.1 Unannotated [Lentimonas sp. CC11]
MKHILHLSTLTLFVSAALTLTGCESHEIKQGTDDVIDVMRNGVDVVTDTGNKAADAMKSDKE